jgi:glycosyltransferase involved in cell wall biosynthesis
LEDGVEARFHPAWIEGIFLSPSLAFALASAKKETYDIIYVVNCRDFPSTLGILSGKRTGGRTVLSANGTLGAYRYLPVRGIAKRIAYAFQNSLLPRLLERVDIALAVSNAEAEHYSRFGIPQSQTRVVHNGIDLNVFRPGSSGFRKRIGLTDEFVVSFVGRLDPIKGLPVLFEAFRLFVADHSHSKLLVIGPDFGMKDTLLRLSKDLGTQSKVLFVDTLTTKPLVEAYRASDVVVIPSYYEVFGMTAIEAMACGTPVVATNVGALSEIIEEGSNGYLVPSGNSQALASRLSRIATATKIAYQSKTAETASRFDVSKICSEVENIFKQII